MDRDLIGELLRFAAADITESNDEQHLTCALDHIEQVERMLDEAWEEEDAKLPRTGPWLRKEVKHT